MPDGRLTGRAAVAAVVLGLLAGSGAFLQLGLGPREAARGRPAQPATGSWYCPHGGADGWAGWIVITNPGRSSVTIRATTFGEGGVTGASTFVVGANRQVYRDVPVGDPGAATQVEYFGGWVGAASIVTAGGRNPGAAAGRCVAAPRQAWYLPDESTGRAQTAYVVVMNPFSVTAQFEVMIRTEQRTLHPGPLTPFVIRPGTSVGLRLNRYALLGAKERTAVAYVTARSGRVIAGSVGISPDGIRAEAGSFAAATRWTFPVDASGRAVDLAVVNGGDSRSDLAVISQGTTGQRVVSDVNGVSVPAEEVRTIQVEGVEGGILLESTNDHPIVAMIRLRGSERDLAAIGGAAPAGRWIVLPSAPPAGGRGLLVLQNPGREAATLSIRVVGARGAVAAPGLSSRVVQPGHIFQLDLSEAIGPDPVTVVVVATRGSIVAGSAAYPSGGGFAATPGIPIPSVAGQV